MVNKRILIGVLVAIIALAGISFISNNEKKEIVVYFPIDKDFPNPDQGSAVFKFNFPEKEFKVGNELADVLMLLDSKTIPELKILYHQKERKLYAGNPLLITKEIVILDGKEHKIEYTFNREQKQQNLFLDGNLLASGEFTGELTAFTGYAVYEPRELFESPVKIEASFG